MPFLPLLAHARPTFFTEGAITALQAKLSSWPDTALGLAQSASTNVSEVAYKTRTLPNIPESILSGLRRLMKKRLMLKPHLLILKKETPLQKGKGLQATPKSFFSTSVEAPLAFLTSILTEQGLDPTKTMQNYTPNTGRNVRNARKIQTR